LRSSLVEGIGFLMTCSFIRESVEDDFTGIIARAGP
jgi:hypothetical protein